MKVSYTVNLDRGRITYKGDYQCYECGWVDNDRTFFYERTGQMYCSLHKEGK